MVKPNLLGTGLGHLSPQHDRVFLNFSLDFTDVPFVPYYNKARLIWMTGELLLSSHTEELHHAHPCSVHAVGHPQPVILIQLWVGSYSSVVQLVLAAHKVIVAALGQVMPTY